MGRKGKNGEKRAKYWRKRRKQEGNVNRWEARSPMKSPGEHVVHGAFNPNCGVTNLNPLSINLFNLIWCLPGCLLRVQHLAKPWEMKAGAELGHLVSSDVLKPDEVTAKRSQRMWHRSGIWVEKRGVFVGTRSHCIQFFQAEAIISCENWQSSLVLVYGPCSVDFLCCFFEIEVVLQKNNSKGDCGEMT